MSISTDAHKNETLKRLKYKSMISLITLAFARVAGDSDVKGPISVVLTLMLSYRHLSTSLEVNGPRGGRQGSY